MEQIVPMMVAMALAAAQTGKRLIRVICLVRLDVTSPPVGPSKREQKHTPGSS